MMNKKEQAKMEKYYADELSMPPECDALCRFRNCYNKGQDKGAYNVGRGYAYYYERFIPACLTRLNCGCPDITFDDKIHYKANKFMLEKLEEVKASAPKRRCMLLACVSGILKDMQKYLEQKGEKHESV